MVVAANFEDQGVNRRKYYLKTSELIPQSQLRDIIEYISTKTQTHACTSTHTYTHTHTHTHTRTYIYIIILFAYIHLYFNKYLQTVM